MRAILISAMLACVISTVHAQTKEYEFQVGPNWGMLRSNPENDSSYSSKVGLTLGIGMNHYYTSSLSLGVRLLYQRETIRGYYPSSGQGASGALLATTSFNKATVPIVFRYSRTMNSKIKITSEFGAFLSYQISESVKDVVPDLPVFLQAAEYTKQYTIFDAGLYAGLSMEVPIAQKLNLKLAVFDNVGLVNISQIQFENYKSFKTNSLNVVVGIVWPTHVQK